MYIRLSLFAAFLGAVSASFPLVTEQHGVTRLLDEDADYSWMNGYSVLYENCFPNQKLASFRLCPADSSCRADCSGAGEYLLDLATFIDAFTEAQLGGREYRCEMARENCAYDDDALCFTEENGLAYCQENEDEFDLQEYLECKEFDDNYYIGPYCAEDNFNIHLGLFTDEDCSVPAGEDVSFEETYGYVLEYSAEAEVSIVADECAECREHHNDQDQDEDDQEDEDDVIEQCEELYAYSTKCESSGVGLSDETGCSYIKELQKADSVTIGGVATESHKTRNIILWSVGAILAIALLGGCFWFSMRQPKTALKEELVK